MSFTYENQGSNSFLVYKLEEGEQVDTFNYGMLSNNKISGVMPVNLLQKNDEKYLQYNVSSKVVLRQFFEGIVNKKRIITVFSCIIRAVLEAEEYMLDARNFIFDMDYIFVDVTSAKASIISLPLIGNEGSGDIAGFFKNIMFSTQFEQSENTDYVAKIISYLNGTNNFSLQEFKKLLQDALDSEKSFSYTMAQSSIKSSNQNRVRHSETNSGSGVQAIPYRIPEPQAKANDASKSKDSASEKKKKRSLLHRIFIVEPKEETEDKKGTKPRKEKKEAKKKNRGKKENAAPNMGFAVPGQAPTYGMPKIPEPAVKKPNSTPAVPASNSVQRRYSSNFGETTVLGSDTSGETTVLGSSVIPAEDINPRLKRVRTGEVIHINKPVLRIGKEESYVDYCIKNNTSISRSHANLISKEGKFYIVDTNSTNHTFVNDSMIPGNEEIRIEHGSKLKLADEEFEFLLY